MDGKLKVPLNHCFGLFANSVGKCEVEVIISAVAISLFGCYRRVFIVAQNHPEKHAW
jgi:hypothetical protein